MCMCVCVRACAAAFHSRMAYMIWMWCLHSGFQPGLQLNDAAVILGDVCQQLLLTECVGLKNWCWSSLLLLKQVLIVLARWPAIH